MNRTIRDLRCERCHVVGRLWAGIHVAENGTRHVRLFCAACGQGATKPARSISHHGAVGLGLDPATLPIVEGRGTRLDGDGLAQLGLPGVLEEPAP